jgi:hypothetical protein
MGDVESKVSNRIELRVTHSMATTLGASMTVSNEGHAISFPVRTQLGMPITVSVGDDTFSLHNGILFIHDGGHASHSAKSTKKRTYGLVQYLARTEAEAEAQEQFHVKLYVPTERYNVIWDLSARGHLPRLISLQVKGLQDDARWDVSNVGAMLLVEDFSLSFPIASHGLHAPT